MIDSTPKAVAQRIAEYATTDIVSMGIPKSEWLDIFLDAQNLFATEHGLLEKKWEPSFFNAEQVTIIPRDSNVDPEDN